MIDITSLTTPIPAAQWRTTMVSQLIILGIPADKWRSGGIASTILTVVSMVFEALSILLAAAINGFFLPTATGANLVNLALYEYGVVAPTATFASGNETLTNSGGGVYSQAIGTVQIRNPTTGQVYLNTAAFTLASVGNPGAVATVPFQCTVAGSVGNSSPNTITTLDTALLGVTVTNPTSFVGLDALSDPALRALCQSALGVRSVRGPRTAYQYAIQTATNATTGLPVNINRQSISESSHTGQVTIYVASPSGAATADDVTGVINSIEAQARPEAVTVSVTSASPVNYTASLIVWCTLPTGINASTMQTNVATALTTFFSTFAVGGVTAADDPNPGTFTGLFADTVVAVCSGAVAAAGGTLISVQGATDQSMTPIQVLTNATSVTVRAVATPGST